MLAALLVVLRSLGLICRGHRAVALDNVALRQQLAVFRRTVTSATACERSVVSGAAERGALLVFTRRMRPRAGRA